MLKYKDSLYAEVLLFYYFSLCLIKSLPISLLISLSLFFLSMLLSKMELCYFPPPIPPFTPSHAASFSLVIFATYLYVYKSVCTHQ